MQNMEENIVVNVEIDRNGVTTTSVQVVPLDIPWEDFELMVRNIWRKLFGNWSTRACSAGHRPVLICVRPRICILICICNMLNVFVLNSELPWSVRIRKKGSSFLLAKYTCPYIFIAYAITVWNDTWRYKRYLNCLPISIYFCNYKLRPQKHNSLGYISMSASVIVCIHDTLDVLV